MSPSPVTLNSKTTASENWLTHSVQEFFSAINWELNAPEVHEVKQAVSLRSDRPIPLTFTVSQFLNCIPWEGVKTQEVVSPEPVLDLNSVTPSVTEFTLDDFSSLF